MVVLDLNMPGVNGLAVLGAVAAHERLATRHAYIVVTAHPDTSFPPHVATLLGRLQVAIIAKPFDIDAVLEAVRQAAATLDATALLAAYAVPARLVRCKRRTGGRARAVSSAARSGSEA